MREIGHGPQPLWVCFQFPEPCTDAVNHVIKRWKRQVGELFFADVFPDMFHRIEFRTVGWLWDETDILGYGQRFGAMPARAIHLHHDKLLGKGLTDVLEKELHHGRIGCWQHQGGHFPLGWGHSGIDVGGLTHDLPRGAGADSRRSPGASWNTHPAKAPLICGHLQHGALIVGGAGGDGSLDRLREVFLNAACSVFVGFRMEGAWGELAPGVAV
jgi:hypothetical protein